MSDYLKPVVFAAIMSVVCSSLLTLASTGLKEYQLKNIALDKQKNILKSAGLIDMDNPPPPDVLNSIYETNIKQVWVDVEGKITTKANKSEQDLPVYLHVKDGKIQSYIIPIDSRGLWGKIYGYLALKNDGKTVSGFTVYSHSETPGLGGEIEKIGFQKNFAGKKILDEKGNFASVTIAKGKVIERIATQDQQNYVDGISGASLTGKFLTAGLKENLIAYEHLSKRFRNNDIQYRSSPKDLE